VGKERPFFGKSESVARAMDLFAEKYCSVSIVLGKTAMIMYDFDIAGQE
jgi:uncharacterized OsmC-like protein